MQFFRKHKNTIRRRLSVPLVVIFVLQALMYVFLFSQGNVADQLREDAVNILRHRTKNQMAYFEGEMRHRWGELRDGRARIMHSIDATLFREQKIYSSIKTDKDLSKQILLDLTPHVTYILRRNEASAAYIILDSKTHSGGRAGIYLRNPNPQDRTYSNADLLLERGPIAVAQSLGISFAVGWQDAFYFSDNNPDDQYFFGALSAAHSGGWHDSNQYGIWTSATAKDGENRILHCSIPLLSSSGAVFGVIGVEITPQQLASHLKSEELAPDQFASYALGIHNADGKITRIFSSEELDNDFFENARLSVDQIQNNALFSITEANNRTLLANVYPLNLHTLPTDGQHENWVLIGFADQDGLFASFYRFRRLILMTSVITLVFGLVTLKLVSNAITEPIGALVSQLRRSNPNQPIMLSRINIEEIDTLSASIEELSRAVAQSASKISQIIEMTNIPVGVFEYLPDSHRVFCSDNFFSLTQMAPPRSGNSVSVNAFTAHMRKINGFLTDSKKRIFRIPCGNGQYRWLRMTHISQDQRVLGAFLDITKEMLELQKVEYERDYDVLTELYNRRAFEQQVTELFAQPHLLKTAALVMWDLDNLKYINDTFGHSSGDQYICALARQLNMLSHQNGIVARRSGDEFYVLLYGYDSKNAILKLLEETWQRIRRERLEMPSGESLKIRVSAGVAWYPQDAQNWEELFRYADFSMYCIKRSGKNDIQEFDKASYLRSAPAADQDLSHFVRMMDAQEVQFAFQPVVDVSRAQVYGYEMLMRPKTPGLRTPFDVLRIARLQSKLYEVERLTMFYAMQIYKEMVESGKLAHGCKVFLNSISNQMLNEQDLALFRQRYDDYLSCLALELVDAKPADCAAAEQKFALQKATGGLIVLDSLDMCISNGCSSLSMKPDFIKIDMSIVRNIHEDAERQATIRQILVYARKYGIKTLAVGVETREEMQALIALGVGYLQGFYLGEPAFSPATLSTQVMQEIGAAYQDRHKTIV